MLNPAVAISFQRRELELPVKQLSDRPPKE